MSKKSNVPCERCGHDPNAYECHVIPPRSGMTFQGAQLENATKAALFVYMRRETDGVLRLVIGEEQ